MPNLPCHPTSAGFGQGKRVLTGIILTAALAGGSPPFSVAAAQTSNPRRFEEVYTFTSSVTEDRTRCPVLTVEADGRGQMRLFGEFTIIQHHCIHPGGPAPLAFRRGSFTKTNSRGEHLVGTYAGRLVPTPSSDRDGVFLIDGALILTGGTGRFKGVDGGAAISGLLNVTTGRAGVVIDGEIRFPPGADAEFPEDIQERY